MQPIEKIQKSFNDHLNTLTKTLDVLVVDIARAAETVVQTLLDGGKILSCGNGGSSCDAQHFASEMLNRFYHERPGLPGIALTADMATITAIANDYQYSEVFSKQIRALAKPGDILLAITTSGHSPNIVQAIRAAHDRQMKVIALTGKTGGDIPELLQEFDIELRVPSSVTARIQEMHLLILHNLCELIDLMIFGHED